MDIIDITHQNGRVYVPATLVAREVGIRLKNSTIKRRKWAPMARIDGRDHVDLIALVSWSKIGSPEARDKKSAFALEVARLSRAKSEREDTRKGSEQKGPARHEPGASSWSNGIGPGVEYDAKKPTPEGSLDDEALRSARGVRRGNLPEPVSVRSLTKPTRTPDVDAVAREFAHAFNLLSNGLKALSRALANDDTRALVARVFEETGAAVDFDTYSGAKLEQVAQRFGLYSASGKPHVLFVAALAKNCLGGTKHLQVVDVPAPGRTEATSHPMWLVDFEGRQLLESHLPVVFGFEPRTTVPSGSYSVPLSGKVYHVRVREVGA